MTCHIGLLTLSCYTTSLLHVHNPQAAARAAGPPHERRRPGARPAQRHRALAAGGAACVVAAREMGRDLQHVQRLERRLREGISGQLQVGVCVSGCGEQQWWRALAGSCRWTRRESSMDAWGGRLWDVGLQP